MSMRNVLLSVSALSGEEGTSSLCYQTAFKARLLLPLPPEWKPRWGEGGHAGRQGGCLGLGEAGGGQGGVGGWNVRGGGGGERR